MLIKVPLLATTAENGSKTLSCNLGLLAGLQQGEYCEYMQYTKIQSRAEYYSHNIYKKRIVGT